MTTNAKLRAGLEEALCHLHGKPLKLVNEAMKAAPMDEADKMDSDRGILSDVLEIATPSLNPDDFVELERILGVLVKTRHLDDPEECPDCQAYSDKGIAPRCGEHASNGVR